MANKGGLLARVWGWVQQHVPTREAIERNRFLRPVAHRILMPALWRFTRRSVPRGVALGIATGILAPFVHAPAAAMLALPTRANVPVAVGVTFLHNPLTTVPIYWCAYQLGHWILHYDRQVPGRPIAGTVVANASWLHWLVAQGGPATIVGLLAMAFGGALIGYAAASLVWQVRIARKWRARNV